MEYITPLLGNIGTVILLIVLWKSGVLKFLLDKNGNGKKDDRLDTLEAHFNHEITEALLRIEKKLDDIVENTIIIKTKINGK